MSLMDWFFPEQAEAQHLRSIARSMRRQERTRRRADRKTGTALSDLEDDLGFLALTLLSLVGTLVEKGVLAEEEFAAHLARVDGLDGVEDGRLSPDALRGALGFPRPKPPEPKAPTPTPRVYSFNPRLSSFART